MRDAGLTLPYLTLPYLREQASYHGCICCALPSALSASSPRAACQLGQPALRALASAAAAAAAANIMRATYVG